MAVYRRRSLSAAMLVGTGLGIAGLCVYGSGMIHPVNVEGALRDVVRVPGVFGVTRHTYILFCANAFALLVLRAVFLRLSQGCCTGSCTCRLACP